MRYYRIKTKSKNNTVSAFPTQKQLIEQINAHTRVTRRLAEILVAQATQSIEKERKHGSTI